MADTLAFSLVSPERQLAAMDATMVQIPGIMGDLAAMPAHAPFLTTLRPGIVSVHAGGATHDFFVTGGFAEISPAAATVLAEEAVERAMLKREFLDAKLAEAEEAAAQASDETRTAANQLVNDFRSAIALLNL
jgi:F-type H+-transporting ATPase subunit epsilon